MRCPSLREMTALFIYYGQAESSFWRSDLSVVHAFCLSIMLHDTTRGGGSWWSCQLIASGRSPSGTSTLSLTLAFSRTLVCVGYLSAFTPRPVVSVPIVIADVPDYVVSRERYNPLLVSTAPLAGARPNVVASTGHDQHFCLLYTSPSPRDRG